MQRLFITALACLMSVSVVGQGSEENTDEFVTPEVSLKIINPSVDLTSTSYLENTSAEYINERCAEDIKKIIASRLMSESISSQQKLIAEVKIEIKEEMKYGWAVIRASTLFISPLLGCPSRTIEVGLNFTITLKDNSGKYYDHFTRHAKTKFPVGLWYKKNSTIEKYRSVCSELVNQCITEIIDDNVSSTINSIAASIKTSPKPKDLFNINELNNGSGVSFNQFEREFPVERIFVVANEGEDCDGNTRDGEDIALLAETMLLGEYDILERKHFEQVLDEQRLAASGLLLEETAVELGCNAGSQGIIFTEIGCLSDKTTINLKLVGCQTSEIYWSCIGIGTSPLKTVQKVKQELSKD